MMVKNYYFYELFCFDVYFTRANVVFHFVSPCQVGIYTYTQVAGIPAIPILPTVYFLSYIYIFYVLSSS